MTGYSVIPFGRTSTLIKPSNHGAELAHRGQRLSIHVPMNSKWLTHIQRRLNEAEKRLHRLVCHLGLFSNDIHTQRG